jgi:putative exporter of polyketide antibiotics
MQVASIRAEEADERLETSLVLPVRRRSWLAGRLLLAAAGAAAVGLAAGTLAWAGAAAQGAGVDFPDMLGAGANTLPAALLFLGLGVLAFAVAPRASIAVVYGLVGGTFVWWTFGALLGAPEWLLALSPFHDVGLVPGEPFKAIPAVIMIATFAAASIAAIVMFERRDLTAN